jgi:hypothetical protein
MREGTTWRVMAADRPYGEFHEFYSVSPEYFGYTLEAHSSIAQPVLASLDRYKPAGPACSKLHNFGLYRFLVIQLRETITCFSTNVKQTGFVLATHGSRIFFYLKLKVCS